MFLYLNKLKSDDADDLFETEFYGRYISTLCCFVGNTIIATTTTLAFSSFIRQLKNINFVASLASPLFSLDIDLLRKLTRLLWDSIGPVMNRLARLSSNEKQNTVNGDNRGMSNAKEI